jgi:hypothetical protein
MISVNFEVYNKQARLCPFLPQVVQHQSFMHADCLCPICKHLLYFKSWFGTVSAWNVGYKNVFGPIAVLVTNRFLLEQKSYLSLKLQFMSGFGKTTIFNGHRPNQYTFPTRFHVIHKYSRSGKLWTIKRILSTYNVCDLVSSKVRKFIHSICCKMYTTCTIFILQQLLTFPVIF